MVTNILRNPSVLSLQSYSVGMSSLLNKMPQVSQCPSTQVPKCPKCESTWVPLSAQLPKCLSTMSVRALECLNSPSDRVPFKCLTALRVSSEMSFKYPSAQVPSNLPSAQVLLEYLECSISLWVSLKVPCMSDLLIDCDCKEVLSIERYFTYMNKDKNG